MDLNIPKIDGAKLIEVVDPQAGRLRETTMKRSAPVPNLMLESNGRTVRLSEAAASTSEFPQLLRAGLRPILFTSYAGWPGTHQFWIDEEPSSNEFETGIENSAIGKLPKRPEGGEFADIEIKLDRSVQIQNEDRGGILSITWEMVNFDRIGIIRDAVQAFGEAMAYTEEDDAYTVLTTAGNYNRTTAAGDNDIGNNTGTTTFSAGGLNTALQTLATMKDRKSGRYLGVMPDTLVVGVGCEMAAKQLLLSPTLAGVGDTDAVIAHGTGTSNPFRGVVTQIVVSPFLGRYEWVLMQRGRAVRKFVVDDLELLEENQNANSTAYFEKRSIRYRVSKYYGIGMWNDRFAYYSDSTTAPTVD